MVLFRSVSCLFPFNQLLSGQFTHKVQILTPLEASVLINAAIIIYPILGWIADGTELSDRA